MSKWLPFVGLVLVGCGGNESSPPLTAGTDTSVVVDALDPIDTSTAPVDSMPPSPETDVVDSSKPTPDTNVVADTSTPPIDTSAPLDAAGLRKGQCYTNAHCPSGTCRANAPGGICSCVGTSGCSSSTFECNTMFGACVLDCKTDGDCIPGMQCTTSGCGLKTCMNDAACAPTTVCRVLGTGTSKYCQRKLCPDGTGCPTGSTCLTTAEGKSCVETFLVF